MAGADAAEGAGDLEGALDALLAELDRDPDNAWLHPVTGYLRASREAHQR